jgi:excisionase family DNA binding protein
LGGSLTELLSVADWARAEGIGRDAAYKLVAEGRVRHVRIGSRIRIPRSEIEAFAEREGVMAPSEPAPSAVQPAAEATG